MVGMPRLEPGTGPHAVKAVCAVAACGRFITWLSEVMMKETQMVASVNRVVLLGTIGKHGIELRYAPGGAACASFLLVVTEQSQDGKDYATLIPGECWGKRAEAASELDAGALVLFEGKLAKHKKGEAWEMVVSGFEVQPVRAPALGVSGSRN
jgi:primosomal replication protein N